MVSLSLMDAGINEFILFELNYKCVKVFNKILYCTFKSNWFWFLRYKLFY